MKADAAKPVRIVILGGGYVTVWAYRALARRLRGQLRREQVQITVVSLDNYHAFHGWTGEVLGGIIPVPHGFTALRPLLKYARFVRGEALSVDLDAQTVQVRLFGDERCEELRYDHLLFGIGSRDRQERVPGLAAHGWRVKGTGDLLALRNHLIAMMERADATDDPAARAQALSIVVGGGGFAGVEMCAAIAELLKVARRHYPVLRREQPRIVLVHAGDALLPQLRPRYERLVRYATRQLQRYGVELRLGTRLAQVTADGALLSDGTLIPSATVVSTIGQSLTPLAGSEALARDSHGRLLTDAQLHIAGSTQLWAGGDVAHVRHPRSQDECPANALWAIKHGEHVGANIARAALGQPLRPFAYPGLGQAASLGVGKGAVELYGMQFTGWLGWLLRFFFFLYFMPSRAQMIRVALDWIGLPLLGRDFTPLDHATSLAHDLPETLPTRRERVSEAVT
jgi:NADH dehydrogenase